MSMNSMKRVATIRFAYSCIFLEAHSSRVVRVLARKTCARAMPSGVVRSFKMLKHRWLQPHIRVASAQVTTHSLTGASSSESGRSARPPRRSSPGDPSPGTASGTPNTQPVCTGAHDGEVQHSTVSTGSSTHWRATYRRMTALVETAREMFVSESQPQCCVGMKVRDAWPWRGWPGTNMIMGRGAGAVPPTCFSTPAVYAWSSRCSVSGTAPGVRAPIDLHRRSAIQTAGARSPAVARGQSESWKARGRPQRAI